MPDTKTPLPPQPSARPRVLVVDDEPGVRLIARLLLEGSGYAVTDAGSAGEALARVRAAERPFDAILLDQSLPDRPGTALVPDLRALAPATPVVLTSGLFESDMPNHGADGYLPKPFTREQLVAAIRAATSAMPK